MKLLLDSQGHAEHYYISDLDFMYKYTPFERDEVNRRCYFLEASVSQWNSEAKNKKLVRRRISSLDYMVALLECTDALAKEAYAEPCEFGKEDILRRSIIDKANYIAQCHNSKKEDAFNYLPEVCGEAMINDFEIDLSEQIQSDTDLSINMTSAKYMILGYKKALKDLSLISDEKRKEKKPNKYRKLKLPIKVGAEYRGNGSVYFVESLEGNDAELIRIKDGYRLRAHGIALYETDYGVELIWDYSTSGYFPKKDRVQNAKKNIDIKAGKNNLPKFEVMSDSGFRDELEKSIEVLLNKLNQQLSLKLR